MVDERKPPATRAADELRVVARFHYLGEAELALSALRAAGIPAYARDRQTVGVDWFLANALGGIRVEVPASQAAAASEILEGASGDTETLSDEEARQLADDRVWRRRRGVWAIVAVFAPWAALGWWLDRRARRGRRDRTES